MLKWPSAGTRLEACGRPALEPTRYRQGLDSAPFFFARKKRDEVVVGGRGGVSARSQAPHRTRTGISAGVLAGWSWDGRALEVEHDRYGF
jgi:hypothetical protein